MATVILASTSKYRKALVQRLGLQVRCVAPGVDEKSFQRTIANPVELASNLAVAKARAVAGGHSGQIVIGGDQLVAFLGQVLGKPGTADAAIEQLRRLSGNTHELVTAMCVIGPDGTEHTHTDIARMTMRRLDDARIRRYVQLDEPLDCAGAYKIESGGISLFEKIESVDHSAIMGLPLMALTSILERLGIAIPG